MTTSKKLIEIIRKIYGKQKDEQRNKTRMTTSIRSKAFEKKWKTGQNELLSRCLVIKKAKK